MQGEVLTFSRTGFLPHRHYSHLIGLGGEHHVGVHDKDIDTLRRGVAERVFLTSAGDRPIQPEKPFHLRMGTLLKRTLGQASPLSAQAFLSGYRGRKLAIYRRAGASLGKKGISFKCSWVKIFVKAEKMDLSKKTDPVPRIISPRDPRYNYVLGRYIKAIEHKVYSGINKICGSTTIFKGLNQHQRARHLRLKWEKFDKPVAIGIDASRFDQHVSVPALRWEHSIYLHCFQGNKELKQLLDWQLKTHAIAFTRDGTLRYVKEGGRCSGDMNTALGNCLIASSLCYEFLQVHLGLNKWELACDGDDCVIIVEETDCQKILDETKPYFAGFGFDMKVEDPVYHFEGIQFCQCNPVLVGQDWLMVRNPLRCLTHDLISTEVHTERAARQFAWAVGKCGSSVYHSVPILGAFYAWQERIGIKSRILESVSFQNSGFWARVDAAHTQPTAISTRDRVSFWKAFGIIPSVQVEMENRFHGGQSVKLDRLLHNIEYRYLLSQY